MCVNVLARIRESACARAPRAIAAPECVRAEAYRSMAYAHGQLWHVSAALWQVYVAEQSHIREGKIPIGMVSYRRSAPEAHGS